MKITLDGLSDDCELRLLKPITIGIRKTEDGEYVVADDEFSLYGVGESVTDAMADYEATIVDYYEDIVEWGGGLSPHLEKQKTTLQEYLTRRE